MYFKWCIEPSGHLIRFHNDEWYPVTSFGNSISKLFQLEDIVAIWGKVRGNDLSYFATEPRSWSIVVVVCPCQDRNRGQPKVGPRNALPYFPGVTGLHLARRAEWHAVTPDTPRSPPPPWRLLTPHAPVECDSTLFTFCAVYQHWASRSIFRKTFITTPIVSEIFH